MPAQHMKAPKQAREDSSPAKIDVTRKSPVGDISVVTLIRTDLVRWFMIYHKHYLFFTYSDVQVREVKGHYQRLPGKAQEFRPAFMADPVELGLPDSLEKSYESLPNMKHPLATKPWFFLGNFHIPKEDHRFMGCFILSWWDYMIHNGYQLGVTISRQPL